MSNLLGEKTYSVLAAIFLAALVLLAPCKVRNSIEIALGVQQSVSLNKAKSVSAPICCSTKPKIAFVQTKSVSNEFNQSIEQFVSVFNNPISIQFFPEELAQTLSWNILETSSFQSIPYYILHRNFKVYL